MAGATMADGDQRNMLRRYFGVLAAPWMMAVTIAGCCILGVYLDRRLGWSPVLTIALTLLGVAGSGYQAYRMIRKTMKD